MFRAGELVGGNMLLFVAVVVFVIVCKTICLYHPYLLIKCLSSKNQVRVICGQ
jgi:hypothetical protein